MNIWVSRWTSEWMNEWMNKKMSANPQRERIFRMVIPSSRLHWIDWLDHWGTHWLKDGWIYWFRCPMINGLIDHWPNGETVGSLVLLARIRANWSLVWINFARWQSSFNRKSIEWLRWMTWEVRHHNYDRSESNKKWSGLLTTWLLANSVWGPEASPRRLMVVTMSKNDTRQEGQRLLNKSNCILLANRSMIRLSLHGCSLVKHFPSK